MKAMNVPITQSREWETLQEDLSETSFYREGEGYSYLAIKKKIPGGCYFYLPYGPVVEGKVAIKKALADITALAKEQGAVFIRIEPQDPTFIKEIEKSTKSPIKKSHDLNPKETWLLDLKGTDEEYKAKLPSRLLRYYRGREKNGITLETSKNPADIKYLLDLQKALAKKKNISTYSEKYLETELKQPFATLYLLKQEGEVLAAGLVFDHGNTRYNLQGAQSEKGRALHATGILTIQLIEDARAKGLELFDFWGIAPEGAPANHPWAGFTNFKKTFAGYEVDYAGTHDLILKPAKYKAYQLMRKIRRLV